MASFPPPVPLQAAPQPFLPRLAEPVPAPVAFDLLLEPTPAPETTPEPSAQPEEIPSLELGIIGAIVGRAGLVVVAFLMALQFRHGATFAAEAQFAQSTAALDQVNTLKPMGYAFALLAILTSGWWVHRVDESASLLAKFHKQGSWLVPFAPLLLLPLFVWNDGIHISRFMRATDFDFRPMAVLAATVVLLWLPASRTRSAVVAIGKKLSFRFQFALDLVAVTLCFEAFRTDINPLAALESSRTEAAGNALLAAAVVGAIGTIAAAVLMVKTRRLITVRAKELARPEQGVVTNFVVQSPTVVAAAPTRSMVPLAPFRWALLASYGIWVLSHLVSAFTYLRIGDLIDQNASEAQITHQITTATLVSLVGFSVVFIAQWAWVIVVVCNANRATLRAPSLVAACVMGVVPLGLLAAAAFVEGSVRMELVGLGVLLGIISFFLSFSMTSRAVASVGGDMMTIRTWSLAISLWMVIQYFANVLRPPTVQQVVILIIATAVVRAGVLIVAIRTAVRVTAAVDVSLSNFHQVKRVE